MRKDFPLLITSVLGTGTILCVILCLAFYVIFSSWFRDWDCPDAQPNIPDPKLKLVSEKAARYQHVSWQDNDLIFEYDEKYYAKPGEGRIWRMHPDGTNREQLQLPNHPNCQESSFVAPQRLHDGRLGYGVLCIANGTVQTYMMAYDFKTAKGTPLIHYPSPIDLRNIGRDSWNPTATQGIIGDKIGNSAESQMWWLWQDHWSPVKFDLDLAMDPVWSPNGKMIAFTGIAKEERGFAWDAIKDLYLMDSNGANIRSFASGFNHVLDWTWSPDSRWLALSATFNEQGTETSGIWLIEVSTGKRQLIAKGWYQSLDWSSSGKELVVVGPPPANEQQLCYGTTFNTRLYRLDISNAVDQ
ncbi:MAG: PD40 domain-containing protein [Chloroflexi bacterium]|nr:PD40 domain-containing protein [Chloroflexota bacterium]